MRCSLDTNVVLRFLLRDAPKQAAAVTEIIDVARPGSLEVADAALLECVWVMAGPHYDLPRHIISKLIMQFMELPQINCNRKLFGRVLPIYTENKSLSLTDIVLTTYAELNGSAPLLTFDKKLAKLLPESTRLL